MTASASVLQRPVLTQGAADSSGVIVSQTGRRLQSELMSAEMLFMPEPAAAYHVGLSFPEGVI